ncbi:MAG: glycosyltransferase [Flavobacteriales bacterium]|nr:glycosyltransferase [Flavobacteriales bacterium]
MRVLHVIDSLEVGGAEKMVIFTANELVRRGLHAGIMVIVKRGTLANLLNKQVELIELNRKSRFGLRALKNFSCAAHRFDIIHIHLAHNFKYAFVADILFGLPQKIVLHDHSGEVLFNKKKRSKIPLFMRSWMRKCFYIAVSNDLLEFSVNKYRLTPGRYTNLSNAVPVCSNWRLGLKPGPGSPIRLLLTGNVRPIKNIEFAVHFIYFLLKNKCEAYLTIVGNISDQVYYQNLEILIQKFNLQHRIFFAGKVNSLTDLKEQFNLGIHCSHAETGPLVLLEYMMLGLPFIAINRGDVSLQVKSMIPKIILDDFEYTNWQKSLEYVVHNYDNLVKKGLDFIVKLNSFDKYMNKLIQVYSRC